MTKRSLDQVLLKANSHAKRGEIEEAQRLYQDILKMFPKNKRAQQGLANLTEFKQRAGTQNPPKEQIDQLINLYNNRQLGVVIEKAKALTLQYPDTFVFWNILGAAAAQTGQVNQAINAFKKVIEINPDYPDAYNNMGNALKDQGKFNEAIASFNKALSLKPDYAEAYNNLGNALQKQGKLEEAIAYFDKALSLKPNYVDTYNNMGNALKDQEKLKEAIASFNKALSLKPDYAEAHRNLSSLIKYKPGDKQVVLANELIQRSDLNDNDRCQLHYTLAKMNEDLGNLAEAYENFVVGGKLRKKMLSYDFKQDELMFDQIKNTAPKLKELSTRIHIKTITNTPIFILGMPRSGTTLVEQIISAHSQVHGAGELPFLNYFGNSLNFGKQIISSDNILQIRCAYLNALENVSNGYRFVTDKMPQNFWYVGLISKALPEAKIIHVKRDPAATCWSNFKHYFTVNGLGYSYDLNDTVNYFKQYKILMEFWDEQYSNKIYHLDYDTLTRQQEPETRKLIEHLELDWEDNCLSPHENKRSVRTASQQQVRQKVYTGSSRAWQKFLPYLNGAFDGVTP